MSRMQDIQTAEGVALRYRQYGILDYASKNAPVGGEVGYSTGCTWRVMGKTGSVNQGFRYVNIGSNGLSTGVGTSNPTASWVIDDVSGNSQNQAGNSTALFRASGNLIGGVGILSSTGISPSATGADKIVAAFTLPANFFDIAGRGLQVSVWGTAAANGNNKEFKVVLGATNSGITNGTNVAGQTDGTVTVTGGTTILDTGALTTNNGGLILVGQIFKYGAAGSNTQASMTTGIIGGGTHAGCGTWTNQTFTEANALLLAVTARATTTATDIVFTGFECTAFN